MGSVMHLSVTVNVAPDGAVVLSVRGEVDHANAGELRTAIESNLFELSVLTNHVTMQERGLPRLAGFVAKEAVYESFVHGGFRYSPVVLAGVVVGSALTVAYSARVVWAIAWAPRRRLEGRAHRTIGSPSIWFAASFRSASATDSCVAALRPSIIFVVGL